VSENPVVFSQEDSQQVAPIQYLDSGARDGGSNNRFQTLTPTGSRPSPRESPAALDHRTGGGVRFLLGAARHALEAEAMLRLNRPYESSRRGELEGILPLG